uniref:phenylalanine 4-monooxygenase n=1 Tax=Schistocephalus solidus TaxID=70667 RepID=A0A0X3NJD7_SCHSO
MAEIHKSGNLDCILYQRMDGSISSSKDHSLQFSLAFQSKTVSIYDILETLKVYNAHLNRLIVQTLANKNEYNEVTILCYVNPLDVSKLKEALEALGQLSILDDSLYFGKKAPSFPRTLNDLDQFSHRVFSYGSELNADHPGFTDEVYRSRRRYFGKIAADYKHGEPIPRVEYLPEEIETWRYIFDHLTKLFPTHACREFNNSFALLVNNCGYNRDNIPQLEDVSKFLHEQTGFRLRPVAGLLSPREFLAGLAFRVFHSTQYIRHASKPAYTPEPDVCHELIGHVPMLADPTVAQLCQDIGLASLGASEDDIKRLSTCFWFTIEFGLCREDSAVKAYGAGLLSSFGELQYALSDKPRLQPFEPEVTAIEPYIITEYQSTYFVAESFEKARQQFREYAQKINKPFQIEYDTPTESVRIIDPADHVSRLLEELKVEIQKTQDYIRQHMRKD